MRSKVFSARDSSFDVRSSIRALSPLLFVLSGRGVAAEPIPRFCLIASWLYPTRYVRQNSGDKVQVAILNRTVNRLNNDWLQGRVPHQIWR